MDSLDIRIFLAMGTRNYMFQGGQNRQLNLKLIAKELNVDPDTVRARIRKMEEKGFIKYYQVFPNYRIFGLHCFALGLIFPEIAAKKEALKKLKLIENVAWIDERLHSLRVLLLYRAVETDLERNLTLIEELTGTKPMLENNLEMLPVGIELGLMDWLIIKSIRYDARKSTEQVAKELGLTARGVNYRLQKLVKGNAFFIVPVIRLENIFCSHFTFFLDKDKRAAAVNEIDRLVGDRCMSRLIGSEGSATFCVLTKSVNKSEEDYLKMKAIPGVKRVIMDFTQCSHDTSAYFDRLINEKIADLEKKTKPKRSACA
jgi:DNA-binding Lrp family transcriptional regulator